MFFVRHFASKPAALMCRSSGVHAPPNDGCGQLEVSWISVLSPTGAMKRLDVPVMSIWYPNGRVDPAFLERYSPRSSRIAKRPSNSVSLPWLSAADVIDFAFLTPRGSLTATTR